MGKGARVRKKRQCGEKLIDVSTHPVSEEPRLSHDERLVLIDLLTRSANRRGAVRGIVGVRNGQVNKEQLSELVSENPSADVFVINTKEET